MDLPQTQRYLGIHKVVQIFIFMVGRYHQPTPQLDAIQNTFQMDIGLKNILKAIFISRNGETTKHNSDALPKIHSP